VIYAALRKYHLFLSGLSLGSNSREVFSTYMPACSKKKGCKGLQSMIC
jgi:hypothetical protein